MSVKSVFRTAIRLYLLFAVIFLVITACAPDPFFIAVKSIDNVPNTGTVGIPLTLTGKVSPSFASNSDIIWLVVNAGITEAVINGNILNAYEDGTVLIKAIIANGLAEGKDYTQDFKIVFNNSVVDIGPISGIVLTVTAPAKNETPDTAASGSATGNAADGGNFTISPVSWSPDDNPFKGETEYTATVTLTADTGYTFTGLTAATVNGNSANISDNTGATVTISYTFAPTFDEEYTDVVYSEDGSRVTLYLDGVGVPLTPSQRAILTDSAKIAYDYLEAVFISGSAIARAQWELGQSADVSGVAKGASGIGIDYAWEADKTAASTIALIAVGRKDGKTLLGIGDIKYVDGDTNTKIYPETKSVTFYIETIKKGLVAAGDSPASAYDSFDFVSSGSTIPTWTRDGHSARFPIGDSSYPMYFLPEETDSIQLAEYKFFDAAVTFAQQIRLNAAATSGSVVIQKRIPRYMDNGRYMVANYPIDTKTTVTLGTYTNTAGSPLDPVIPLVFTTKGTGIFSFYIEIPVYILTSANGTNTGSLPPVAWRIRTGIGSELYSLDDGKGGNGGCVLMGVGVTNLDDVEWQSSSY